MTGTPSLLRQGLNSLSTMVLNNFAGVYGDAAVAAVSIVTRIVMFLNCVTIGIGQGFQPVSAFNYGAKIYRRVKEGFFYSLKSALLLMAALSVLAWVFAPQLIAWFRDDPEVIRIGGKMLRIQCIGMFISPLSVSIHRKGKNRLLHGLSPPRHSADSAGNSSDLSFRTYRSGMVSGHS